jgi:hypothetical protein
MNNFEDVFSYILFSKLEGMFYAWIRIRILNADPDLATQINTDSFRIRIFSPGPAENKEMA